LARFFQTNDKEYLASIKLGITTNTFDQEGKIIKEAPVPTIPPEQARQILSQFIGNISQQAPVFSAIKLGGKPLYKLARQNQHVQPPWRNITIHRIVLKKQNQKIWELDVHCASGTYIRSLAQDIGQALGCGAHLQKLCRTRSGNFKISQAIDSDQIENQWHQSFFPLEMLLPELPRVDLDDQQSQKVRHGLDISKPKTQEKDFFRLFQGNHLIAIGKSSENQLIHPIVVLDPI
jgi:tRNA pseudouridine55 synthase